jgi:hypothetical protein
MLKSKSEKLAKRMGHNDFKAIDGWLSQWKCRFGMKFKKAHSEKDCVVAVNAEQWKSIKLPNLLQKICADDNYNADETVYFIVPCWMVPLATNTQLCFKESNGLCNSVVIFNHVRN